MAILLIAIEIVCAASAILALRSLREVGRHYKAFEDGLSPPAAARDQSRDASASPPNLARHSSEVADVSGPEFRSITLK